MRDVPEEEEQDALGNQRAHSQRPAEMPGDSRGRVEALHDVAVTLLQVFRTHVLRLKDHALVVVVIPVIRNEPSLLCEPLVGPRPRDTAS